MLWSQAARDSAKGLGIHHRAAVSALVSFKAVYGNFVRSEN